mmetsp:Transcript_306/g.675  ORF Transcript_306/g.675 Transcript_306/m.675 type:complete len:224 (-) Transcript_306:54-725(-)
MRRLGMNKVGTCHRFGDDLIGDVLDASHRVGIRHQCQVLFDEAVGRRRVHLPLEQSQELRLHLHDVIAREAAVAQSHEAVQFERSLVGRVEGLEGEDQRGERQALVLLRRRDDAVVAAAGGAVVGWLRSRHGDVHVVGGRRDRLVLQLAVPDDGVHPVDHLAPPELVPVGGEERVLRMNGAAVSARLQLVHDGESVLHFGERDGFRRGVDDHHRGGGACGRRG